MKHRRKKILITGGAGMIGYQTALNLFNKQYEVIIFDLPEQIKRLKKKYKNVPKFKFIAGSILDRKILNRSLNKVDIVYHFAAMLGVKKTETLKKDCIEININGTKNILSASAKNKVKRVIFASSSEVYGEPKKNPIDESFITQGKTIYAITKLAGEELCKAYYQKYKLSFTILRYFNTYSQYQDKNFVISKFTNLIKKKNTITINGNGTQLRSYTHASDTAGANALILLKLKETKNITLNIGNSIEPITLKKLAQKIAKICKTKLKYKLDKNFNKTDRNKDREINNRFCSGKLALKVLGWKSEISLNEGIKKFLS